MKCGWDDTVMSYRLNTAEDSNSKPPEPKERATVEVLPLAPLDCESINKFCCLSHKVWCPG